MPGDHVNDLTDRTDTPSPDKNNNQKLDDLFFPETLRDTRTVGKYSVGNYKSYSYLSLGIETRVSQTLLNVKRNGNTISFRSSTYGVSLSKSREGNWGISFSGKLIARMIGIGYAPSVEMMPDGRVKITVDPYSLSIGNPKFDILTAKTYFVSDGRIGVEFGLMGLNFQSELTAELKEGCAALLYDAVDEIYRANGISLNFNGPR